MIASIVRTVTPGALCSHPTGRFEVEFLAAYRPCLHSTIDSHDARLSARGRNWEETLRQADQLCETFNRCCHTTGIRYAVEIVDDESPFRAPHAR